ncbi:MAG: peptidase [Rhodobacteraceae bacterium]|jgi:putative iron-regulated protein|uniref:Putative iron-regulated protein n=1 Tax=Salipiger profundus TaxID=1229727 RepID=A0A1U7DB61_9RHOB|nr:MULTISPECIES: imelysin family protein [Salipiger]APX25358.1 putative iron-regulated protein [Salipiger profundus]MAB05345.1 peptidase [Paracoccaceae bacterium]GGA24887.1 peptidase [Salipiger profundus]SFD85382.1 putative iron-regulated protein [Salipiger profundus]
MKFATATALGLLLAAPAFAATEKSQVLDTYADIAEAGYTDSLTTAKALREAVDALIAEPSEETLQAAREAWVAARVPYQQTEAYRFGNPIVDDWEGKVNAWPLDEGLMDYVSDDYMVSAENDYADLNVIANPQITIGGQEIDASEITPELIADTLDMADGIETNVARGYHAIEFLLWGQDLNGTDAGAGERPYTDYVTGDDCTGGNCDRRASYLDAATDLLISDLEEMAEAWGEGGAAREAVMADEDAGITAMLTGMGSLSYGEQAGERMRLGLMLNDPEEEHDCFSDNTHNSHFYDGKGIQNVYLGEYTRVDGSVVEGPSLSDLVAETDESLDAEMTSKLETTMERLGAIKSAAEDGFAYDQMLGFGDERGEELIMGAVDALIDQTRTIERVVGALDLENVEIEGSDSLDDPNAVFQ